VVRPSAGGADVAERDDEQHQADPVGEEPDGHRGGDVPDRGQLRAEGEREDEVDRPRDAALDRGEPRGVVERDFAGEVVVDAPAQARAEDREGRPGAAELDPLRDGEDDGAGDEGGHADGDAAPSWARCTRGERRMSRMRPRPMPDPVRSPASGQGLTESRSSFAAGVPAPNRTADSSAAWTPRLRRLVSTDSVLVVVGRGAAELVLGLESDVPTRSARSFTASST
jgi:hypothetical protein